MSFPPVFAREEIGFPPQSLYILPEFVLRGVFGQAAGTEIDFVNFGVDLGPFPFRQTALVCKHSFVSCRAQATGPTLSF
ncbi:hypothetical protein BV898_14890 [Hypsibius exemplaris]|uniref:Uncharacterized protein n=1 Tax=Hypsibius exemplaris TaxID=2072580 RepID=A0A9X6NCU4_HYPEX|nr:hypothetical protein BV898_14890 [Hypsibius exemplaris]